MRLSAIALLLAAASTCGCDRLPTTSPGKAPAGAASREEAEAARERNAQIRPVPRRFTEDSL
jgi:hypothetical protein